MQLGEGPSNGEQPLHCISKYIQKYCWMPSWWQTISYSGPSSNIYIYFLQSTDTIKSLQWRDKNSSIQEIVFVLLNFSSTASITYNWSEKTNKKKNNHATKFNVHKWKLQEVFRWYAPDAHPIMFQIFSMLHILSSIRSTNDDILMMFSIRAHKQFLCKDFCLLVLPWWQCCRQVVM